MTWGSNATFMASRCPYCGSVDIDDTDRGPSSHQRECRGHRLRRHFRVLAWIAAMGMVLWLVWEAVHAAAEV
jgi:hypothetical protein